MKETPIKDLTINGTLYAKYTIDEKILFLKVIKNIGAYTVGESEEIYFNLIRSIEGVAIEGMAYLNI